ncbi:uncharacterized protein LOC101848721 [Aplysia californica]|uniref:Uncharacterized protein LOC101848721 n=1 Tax=Aplysia californica TaxID=6500 RepID=A0ABM0JE93_APLCA|nr:uncharacterized protein LOC101848721 [Aplysia californica]
MGVEGLLCQVYGPDVSVAWREFLLSMVLLVIGLLMLAFCIAAQKMEEAAGTNLTIPFSSQQQNQKHVYNYKLEPTEQLSQVLSNRRKPERFGLGPVGDLSISPFTIDPRNILKRPVSGLSSDLDLDITKHIQKSQPTTAAATSPQVRKEPDTLNAPPPSPTIPKLTTTQADEENANTSIGLDLATAAYGLIPPAPSLNTSFIRGNYSSLELASSVWLCALVEVASAVPESVVLNITLSTLVLLFLLYATQINIPSVVTTLLILAMKRYIVDHVVRPYRSIHLPSEVDSDISINSLSDDTESFVTVAGKVQA